MDEPGPTGATAESPKIAHAGHVAWPEPVEARPDARRVAEGAADPISLEWR